MKDAFVTHSLSWLTKDPAKAAEFRRALKEQPDATHLLPSGLATAIDTLDTWVKASDLAGDANAMFAQAIEAFHFTDPLGDGAVVSWDDFIFQLKKAVLYAPMFFYDTDSYGNSIAEEVVPAGLVGFPINALLNWPMATQAGNAVFQDANFNAHMKSVLDHWGLTLLAPASAKVLAPDFTHLNPKAIGWLNDEAVVQLNDVALGAERFDGLPSFTTSATTPEDIFKAIFKTDYGGHEKTWGYPNWDSYFTREFNDGVRPIPALSDDTVLNACESAPLQFIQNVARSANFQAKGQAYSLTDIFGPSGQHWVDVFEGGSIYQAFLSALSYHRWHTPVTGRLVHKDVVDGSYYWENAYEGYLATPPDKPDSSAPNLSQPFLSACAARGVMVFETPAFGHVGVITIGMAEVGSNQITAQLGDTLTAGDPLGMFHFGGSTHCLIFEPGVQVDFLPGMQVTDQPNYGSTNVQVCSQIATARKTG